MNTDDIFSTLFQKLNHAFVEHDTNVLYPKTLIIEFIDKEHSKNQMLLKNYMLINKEYIENHSLSGLKIIKQKTIQHLSYVIIYKYDTKLKRLSGSNLFRWTLGFSYIYSRDDLKLIYKKFFNRSHGYRISKKFENHLLIAINLLHSDIFITYEVEFKSKKERDEILNNLDYLYFLINRIRQVIEKNMLVED